MLKEYTRHQGYILEDKEYINPFVDVHRKAKALKDSAREAARSEAGLRESILQKDTEALDKEHN